MFLLLLKISGLQSFNKLKLFQKIKNQKIILASKSPRRKQLLEGLVPAVLRGFEVKTKKTDESFPPHLKKEKIPLYLCKKKAEAFKHELKKNTIIITADTIVWFQGKALNKPENKEEAVEMLKKLSGKKHKVFTAVCIKSKEKEKLFFDETDVYFKTFSEEEINFYIDKYKPYDKAGSYGAQEFIGYIGIEKIKGSFFNVMGLPVKKVYEELVKW